MHPAALEGALKGWDQVGRGFDLGALGAVAFRVLDEVRIAEREAEVWETIHRLLPPDHSVRRIFQDQDDKRQLEANRSFHFLRIYHEAAVAADGEHPALG